MACTSPIQGYRRADGRIDPKSSARPLQPAGRRVAGIAEIPCGGCLDCRIRQASDWALRLEHEARTSRGPDGATNGSFVTLTFSDEGLADRLAQEHVDPATLHKRDVQLFLKRLRKERAGLGGGKIRFFAVGEYGDETQRPHYHLLLFGEDFRNDRVSWPTEDGRQAFRSATLAKLWKYGHHDIRPLTIETINYCARYVVKKFKSAEEKRASLERVHLLTGECFQVEEEFALMSRKPGIGAHWFEKYQADTFPHDYIVSDGKKKAVPKYYMKRLETTNKQLAEEIKLTREKHKNERQDQDRLERREARKLITKHKIRDRKKGKL